MTFSPSQEDTHKLKKTLWIQDAPSQTEMDFYNKAYKYIPFIKWIPWIKMIWIWNSISMNCATKESDIDLFIVTLPHRIWLVRILITLIFQVLWVRKTASKHAGKFCLSFFATTDGLDFSSFALKDDIYLYFWLVHFKPLLDYNNTYKLFLEKNKSWADLKNSILLIQQNKKYIKYKKNTWTIEPKFLTIVNNLLKGMLITKTMKSYEKLWKPYWIIINNDMLKFHNNDIREKIRDEL